MGFQDAPAWDGSVDVAVWELLGGAQTFGPAESSSPFPARVRLCRLLVSHFSKLICDSLRLCLQARIRGWAQSKPHSTFQRKDSWHSCNKETWLLFCKCYKVLMNAVS